jgi:hypothetical protein
VCDEDARGLLYGDRMLAPQNLRLPDVVEGLHPFSFGKPISASPH